MGLPPPRSRHFAAITEPGQLGQLLRDIRSYHGQFITRCALRLYETPLIGNDPQGDCPLAQYAVYKRSSQAIPIFVLAEPQRTSLSRAQWLRQFDV